ncbi:MAG: hypothetical protein RL696_144 [Actinomycetota bacterium]|jgi:hypothetical protein
MSFQETGQAHFAEDKLSPKKLYNVGVKGLQFRRQRCFTWPRFHNYTRGRELTGDDWAE